MLREDNNKKVASCIAKTIPEFRPEDTNRPKWKKPILYFRLKLLKNHTLWRRKYLYSLYKGVTPPPGGDVSPSKTHSQHIVRFP